MKILENMDLCYGCGVCSNVCAHGAITMKPAGDGFLYPEIHAEKCVECKACQQVCPQLHPRYEYSRAPKVYAAMADDEIRKVSASGGVFTVLAEYVLEQGGYVCGCTFTEEFRGAKHIMISDKKDLERLRNSKYIQSESGDIYRQVKEKLEQGASVLFVGTPCQCAALTGYLKKPYEKLIVVDLICHGPSSPLAWEKFLEEIAPHRTVKGVNFRYKGVKGWSATTHVEFTEGKPYTKLFKDDPFEQAASKNLITRKSCGTCQFARVPRQGDLTIGDFWGIHVYKKALDDRKGTSAVLVNTEKGEVLLQKLEQNGKFPVYEEVPFFRAFGRNNSNVYRASNTHPGREKFFKALGEGETFSQALAGSKGEKYDIALFSIWYAANFGSMMTNFALYQMLRDWGYNCIFADIPDHLWPSSQLHRDPLFITRRFGYKHFRITPKYKNRADLKKLNEVADIFLVGSDQIWNYSLCKSAGTYFFLDFVEDSKKKIAYGTSFGHKTFRGNEVEKKTAGYYLNRFQHVSVREDYAVDLCRDEFGVDAVQVLDPVFMCDKKHYQACIEQSNLAKRPPEGKYVLAYILDPTEEKQQALEYTAQKLGAQLLCIPNAHVKDDMRAKWRLPILEDIDMEDWLYYFQHAEMVVTDSFHGCCFSLIFEKPFVAIGNKRRGLERFYSLLGALGLMDQLVLDPMKILEKEELMSWKYDYQSINRTLDSLREQSEKWLKQALESKCEVSAAYSAYDVLDRRMDQTVKQMEDRIAKLSKQVEEQKQLLAQMSKEKSKTTGWRSGTLGKLVRKIKG